MKAPRNRAAGPGRRRNHDESQIGILLPSEASAASRASAAWFASSTVPSRAMSPISWVVESKMPRKRASASRTARVRSSTRCSSVSFSSRRSRSARLRLVMSRPTATSRSGLPSAPGSGETTTSHHFCVPRKVAQKPSKWPVPPPRASASAARAATWSASFHSVSQGRPRSSPGSVISMLSRPAGLTNRVRPSRSSTTMQSRLEFRISVFSACASRSAISARRPALTSRETESSRSGLPSAPRIGVTCTSHQRGEPACVGALPWKCPSPPALAASTAARASTSPLPCQKSGHRQPRIALKSLTSMRRCPRSLMKTRLASRSSTLMQSPDAASTLRRNSASAR